MRLTLGQLLLELKRRKRSLPYGELRRLLESVGCRVKVTKDGFLVSHPEIRGYMPTVARPHGRAAGNLVKPVYVGKCIRLIELVVEAKGEPGGENNAGA